MVYEQIMYTVKLHLWIKNNLFNLFSARRCVHFHDSLTWNKINATFNKPGMSNLEGLSHPLPHPHMLTRLRDHEKSLLLLCWKTLCVKQSNVKLCANQKFEIVFTTSWITTVIIWTAVFYRELKRSRAHP